jgi:hypothetical protein
VVGREWGLPDRDDDGARALGLIQAKRVAERPLGRPERERAPGEVCGVVVGDLAGLLGRRRRVRRGGGVDDEDDRVVLAAVDADEPGQRDRDPELLARLAVGGLLGRLAEVDEAARERPEVAARVRAALEQDDPAVRVVRDRAGDRLGVVVGAIAAVRACEAAGVGDRGLSRAARAEAGLGERGVQRRQTSCSSYRWTSPTATKPSDS